MSEEKETKENKTKETTAADVNVALTIVERDEAIRKLSEALDQIEEKDKRIANLEALIEEDSKASLVAYLAERTTLDKSVLSAMKYSDLLNMKKVIDIAQIPAFKSGTPVSYTKKPDPRAKLDSMFHDTMAELKGGKA